ncbi:putative F-box associated interaction domain, F-box-like domain superfamily [Helianthus annuus]|nr:putative F-box associated interaction domain, F-box-like domain superfamily [Helianthus annuus]KAJ0762202.1 putative F-box associated interaction domain, F-box-like domain superfamily [Helianthus annuus]KAJ0927975.1 putative F-box associated interaction domain, F-box-like domain superfamily [Helianthus annuus]
MERVGDDMIFEEILSRLPAKVVCRFKCVSKQWCYELSTPKFVFIHARRVGNSIQKKLLSLKENSIVVDDIVAGNLEEDTSETVTFPYDVEPSFLSIIGSFNGLILLCIKRSYNELVIWNPTTRRFKMISDDYFSRYFGRHNDTGGMYFDEHNDLKVLHINCYWDVVTARVYSRHNDSWRKLNFLNGTQLGSNFYSWSPGIYSDKKIYFMVSNYWIPPGERNIVVFDVISESFSILRFPEHMEVNPCQGHFLTISNKLHVIVVQYAGELIADLVKYEHDEWIKVFSFNRARIVHHMETQERTNIIQNNKWLITSIWGDTVEVVLCNDSFNYIQHVDNYNGPKGALFLETIVSPFD